MTLRTDHWRAAVKLLMGLGVNPELSDRDQRILNSYLAEQVRRNKRAFTEAEAERVLEVLRWGEP